MSAESYSPTPEQARAIAARDRDVFLEAGAGTGKTAVLVGRYCDAVTEDGVAPDEILAFTFTERAAGELRTRIRGELLRRAGAARDEGERERAAELAVRARDSERAWISTIHAFCRRLLATMPLAAGLDPRFRVLDAAEAGRVAERAFDEALEELTVEREAAALLAAGLQVPRLRRLVLSAYESLRGQAIASPRPPPSLECSGEASEEGAESAIGAREYEAVRDLFALFSDRFEAAKRERSGLDFEDLQLGALELLRSSGAAAELWSGRFRHILVDEFQDTNRLQVELIEALCGPATRLFVVGDELQSIYGFRHADLEAFRSERRRAEQAADGERELMRLSGNFRSHPDLVAAVNAIGERLIGAGYAPLTIGREPAAQTGAAEADPGPRVELLLTAATGWAEDGIELRSASESGPASVAEARALAERLAELVAAGTRRSEIVVLLRAYTHAAAYEEALRLAGLEPQVIGGRGYWSHQQVEDLICLLSVIANPLDDEPLLGALASPACGLGADALWLLRRAAGSRRHLWPVLGADPSAEKPTQGPEQGPAQGSLFELVEDGDDDEQTSRYLALIPEPDRRRLDRFHGRVQSLRKRAGQLTLEALCDRASREFGYDLATLAREGGPARIANVRKLMRLAAEYERREGRDLRGFLDYAVSRAAAADGEGQAATEAEGIDGVRVMTVHAAKGLEFPVVAVADLGRPLLAGGSQPDVRIGRIDADAEPRLGLKLVIPGADPISLGELTELADEEAAAAAEEALRLAHVAFTRAQQHLILSGTFAEKHLSRREDPPHSLPVLARLLPELGVDGGGRQRIAVAAPQPREGLEGGFAASEIDVRVSLPSPERALQLGRRRDAAEAPAPEPPSSAPPVLAELRPAPAARPLRPLSYSALADYERCGYRFYSERVLGLNPVQPGAGAGGNGNGNGSEPTPRERRRRFGNAVHRLLEWSARNRWAQPGPELLAATMTAEGLTNRDNEHDNELARADEMIRRWLRSDLRRSLDRPLVRLHPEASFLVNLGGTVVRGQMDLLVELPGEGVLVVDYKTDLIDSNGALGRMARYEGQRDLYALAAREGTSGGRGDPDDDAPAVRTAYAFLDSPGEPIERSYTEDSLAAARAGLELLVAGIRSERFEVSATPHRGLCGDCPARERLCSHPPELTLADAEPLAAAQ